MIVGLASFGQATYETNYNSGIGSNGLTSARHDILNKFYAENFKESYDNSLSDEVVYIGNHRISEIKEILSPTRTYAPLLKKIFENNFDKIYGLIHCSGGGQTKCMKYLPRPMKIVKDNLFTPPIIFDLIQEASGADAREMYQVFNMGTRLEIYTNEKDADALISIAKSFGVDAQVIGRVEASEKKELIIRHSHGELDF